VDNFQSQNNQLPLGARSPPLSSDGSVSRLLQELLLRQEQTNNRLDSMESRLTSFEKTLHLIKSQVLITRDTRQKLLRSNELSKSPLTLKEFVQVCCFEF